MSTLRQPKYNVVNEPKQQELASLWKSGSIVVGDLFVTNKHMRHDDRRPGELPRRWELLVGSSKKRATIPKGSIAMYSGPVRSMEHHARRGTIMAIQHTFIFVYGRFAVLELGVLEPA